MAFPDDLLEQATTLANIDLKRPRQANLRRAASTAYYARFHLLTTAAVANWKQPRLRAELARGVEHKAMNQTCRATKKKQYSKKDHPTLKNATITSLKTVADNFIQLQAPRHTADYDNSKRWSRTEVRGVIELASIAFDSWKLIKKETIAEDFLLRLLIPER